jgi:hypothetical protein
VPDAAAGLADVGAADPQPLVLGRRVEHALEQLAIAGLQLSPFPQLYASLGYPVRERVAYRLQIAKAKRARLVRDRGHPGVDPQAREGIGEEQGELGFQTPDLAPQLRAGEPLVAAKAKRSGSLSIEQVRHSPATSLDHPTEPIAIPALSRVRPRAGWSRPARGPPRRRSGGCR